MQARWPKVKTATAFPRVNVTLKNQVNQFLDNLPQFKVYLNTIGQPELRGQKRVALMVSMGPFMHVWMNQAELQKVIGDPSARLESDSECMRLRPRTLMESSPVSEDRSGYMNGTTRTTTQLDLPFDKVVDRPPHQLEEPEGN